MGHRLRDWSLYALILLLPVIVYVLFGSVIHRWSDLCASVVGGGLDKLRSWSRPITRRRRKRVLHRERRARAKARVRRFRRRALAFALVIRCRRRPSNKPKPLVSPTSEPVRWKWKERNAVGLESVISRLNPSTLDSFCAGNHNFLRLPQLMGTLCNYNYHVQQIKLALD